MSQNSGASQLLPTVYAHVYTLLNETMITVATDIAMVSNGTGQVTDFIRCDLPTP